MNIASELLLVAIHAALKAGEFLSSRFGSNLDVAAKTGAYNFVTDVDMKAESLIIDQILLRFPDHSILSEESGAKSGSQITWIIDPLDGTLNFIRSIPLFAVSIAVAVEGEVVAGCIYLPMQRELFTAEKGKGAFLNGSRITVSSTRHANEAVFVTGAPYHSYEKRRISIEQHNKMFSLGAPLRDLGSAALDLAYVASGRFDAYWMPTVQPWDIASAKVLIEEAGGKFSRYDGSPYTEFVEAPILASNGHLHQILQDELA